MTTETTVLAVTQNYEHDRALTYWGRPTEVMETQYGWITYEQWCRMECLRIPGAFVAANPVTGDVCIKRA